MSAADGEDSLTMTQRQQLHQLSVGQLCTMTGFTEDTAATRRLGELGFLPGREILFVGKAPLRDPIVVKVGCSTYSLRSGDAAKITVEIEIQPTTELLSLS